jgi:hypothetical protein
VDINVSSRDLDRRYGSDGSGMRWRLNWAAGFDIWSEL